MQDEAENSVPALSDLLATLDASASDDNDAETSAVPGVEELLAQLDASAADDGDEEPSAMPGVEELLAQVDADSSRDSFFNLGASEPDDRPQLPAGGASRELAKIILRSSGQTVHDIAERSSRNIPSSAEVNAGEESRQMTFQSRPMLALKGSRF
eukprot:gnl/TRDRNA2_/TRDRNA2_161340_c0_seq1.p1 gnl/TRDRNA2_/TRDRNA2_161340_c0~~gnl/TRDRNA2_/TRDRNA2_161340_c0_seq1.p1  ORF type:complete len:155 (+),score=37.49 gnl/TRDRNA2_/TRDRNA2_161340_c0_seq1:54-518(+)